MCTVCKSNSGHNRLDRIKRQAPRSGLSPRRARTLSDATWISRCVTSALPVHLQGSLLPEKAIADAILLHRIEMKAVNEATLYPMSQLLLISLVCFLKRRVPFIGGQSCCQVHESLFRIIKKSVFFSDKICRRSVTKLEIQTWLVILALREINRSFGLVEGHEHSGYLSTSGTDWKALIGDRLGPLYR